MISVPRPVAKGIYLSITVCYSIIFVWICYTSFLFYKKKSTMRRYAPVGLTLISCLLSVLGSFTQVVYEPTDVPYYALCGFPFNNAQSILLMAFSIFVYRWTSVYYTKKMETRRLLIHRSLSIFLNLFAFVFAQYTSVLFCYPERYSNDLLSVWRQALALSCLLRVFPVIILLYFLVVYSRRIIVELERGNEMTHQQMKDDKILILTKRHLIMHILITVITLTFCVLLAVLAAYFVISADIIQIIMYFDLLFATWLPTKLAKP